jgi:hypothetical protein
MQGTEIQNQRKRLQMKSKIMQGTEKETKTEEKDYRKKTDKQKKKMTNEEIIIMKYRRK